MSRVGTRARRASAGERAPTALDDTVASGEVDPALQETISDTDLDTLAAAPGERASGPPGPVDPAERPLSEDGFDERYAEPRLLGMGGMGEVVATADRRIGREVALKRVRRAADGQLVARFVREARIQAQLEHPAIVPVYDLGIQPDGEPFFTMQRLRGQTLAQRLGAEAAGDPEALRSHRELLTRFADICLAVEYAHQRGVVHRDLKPGNIMLGDFGEAYVLDWGIAKAAGSAEPSATAESAPGQTSVGTVMGTAGYLAPEQLTGAEADPRADVYALGCILFEILTLEPLHRGDTLAELLESTRRGADARATERAPHRDVPPELEAVCVRATATDPDERYPSARALHDDLQAFLEGDRDLRRRRELAASHAEKAEASAARPGVEARREAMREAGRALALDPDNARAIEIVSRLVLEPPAEMPPEVEDESREVMKRSVRQASRYAIRANLAGFALLGLGMLVGLRDPLLVGAIAVFLGGGIVLALARMRADRLLEASMWAGLIWQALFIVVLSRLFGPLVTVPGVAALTLVEFLYHGVLRAPLLAIGVQLTALVTPFVLEMAGVLPPSYQVIDGRLIVSSQFFSYTGGVLYLMLGMAVVVVAILSSFIVMLRRGYQRSERLLALQSWHFRQLVPDEAQVTAETEPAPTCRLG